MFKIIMIILSQKKVMEMQWNQIKKWATINQNSICVGSFVKPKRIKDRNGINSKCCIFSDKDRSILRFIHGKGDNTKI